MVNFLQTCKLANVMKYYISWLMFMKFNQQTMETMAVWWTLGCIGLLKAKELVRAMLQREATVIW